MVEVVNRQVITDNCALYMGDCCEITPNIPSESVGFSLFSPPFADLYAYSDSHKDMSNCKDYKEFFVHFGFLVKELHRIMLPGRVIAVHCMDLPVHKVDSGFIGLKDFPGDIIKLFESYDFIYHSRHCIWKDPLTMAVRTRANGLAHGQLVKDSAASRTAIPDYILGFKKKGKNPKRIKHRKGLIEYFGSRDVPKVLDRFMESEDPKTNKRSHWIWQQYASPVWFDIRQTRVLPYVKARDKDDEKHICPLQMDVIERCLVLWSTKDDIVFSPFMGVGSEIYCAVKRGRKGLGIELKKSYFRQAVNNLKSLDFNKSRLEV